MRNKRIKVSFTGMRASVLPRREDPSSPVGRIGGVKNGGLIEERNRTRWAGGGQGQGGENGQGEWEEREKGWFRV